MFSHDLHPTIRGYSCGIVRVMADSIPTPDSVLVDVLAPAPDPDAKHFASPDPDEWSHIGMNLAGGAATADTPPMGTPEARRTSLGIPDPDDPLPPGSMSVERAELALEVLGLQPVPDGHRLAGYTIVRETMDADGLDHQQAVVRERYKRDARKNVLNSATHALVEMLTDSV